MRFRLRQAAWCLIALSLACAVLYLGLTRLVTGQSNHRHDAASRPLLTPPQPASRGVRAPAAAAELSTWGHCGRGRATEPAALVAVESQQADSAGRAALRSAWARVANLSEATAQLVFFVHHQPACAGCWPRTVQEFHRHGDLVMDSSLPPAGDSPAQGQVILPMVLAWFSQHCPGAGQLVHANLTARLRPGRLPGVLAELLTVVRSAAAAAAAAADDDDVDAAVQQFLGTCSLLATSGGSVTPAVTDGAAAMSSRRATTPVVGNSSSIVYTVVRDDLPGPLCV